MDEVFTLRGNTGIDHGNQRSFEMEECVNAERKRKRGVSAIKWIVGVTAVSLAGFFLFLDTSLKCWIGGFEGVPRKLSTIEAKLLYSLYMSPRLRYVREDDIADQLVLVLLYSERGDGTQYTLWRINAAISVIDKYLSRNAGHYDDEYIFAEFQKLAVASRLSEIKQLSLDKASLRNTIDELNDVVRDRKISDEFQLLAIQSQIGLAESLLFHDKDRSVASFKRLRDIAGRTNDAKARQGSEYFDLYEGIARCNFGMSEGSVMLDQWVESLHKFPGFRKTLFASWDYGLSSILYRYKIDSNHTCSRSADSVLSAFSI